MISMMNGRRLRNAPACLMILLLVALFSSACRSADPKDAGQEALAASKQAAVRAAEPVEISMFVDFPWWPFKDWSGPIPEEITRRTGVKLKISVASDDRELPFLIASDNLPELVFTDKELSRLSNNKMSYDWNSLIAQYAPDFTIDKRQSALYTQANGRFYTLLSGHSFQQDMEANEAALPDGPGLAIRKDLWAALGSPPLETLDDLERVLALVKQTWPDMIPLVSDDVRTFGYFNAQFGQVSADDEFYKDENGSVNYYIKQPGRLDYYTYINKLYREGLLSADNFTFGERSGKALNLVEDGRAFAIIGNALLADTINDRLAGQKKRYEMTMVTGPLSSKVRYYAYSPGWAGVFITQKNSHLQESIRLMKFLFSEEGQKLAGWGLEGRDWKPGPAGYPQFNYNIWDEDLLARDGLYWWGKMAGSAVTEGLRNGSPQLAAAPLKAVFRKYTVYDPAMGMLKPTVYSDERTLQTKLNSMVAGEQLKIYLAKSEQGVQDAYHDMLKKANEIGVQKYEFWANKQYQLALSKLKE